MSHYRLTPQAGADLLEIWAYIASDSLDAAGRVEDQIYAACEFVARSPYSGQARRDLTQLPVRFWTVPRYPNYLIVYDPAAEPIRIIRILHGARDVSSVLL